MFNKIITIIFFLLISILTSFCGDSSSRPSQSDVVYDNGNRDRIVLETRGTCVFGQPITFNKFKVLPKIPNNWCNRNTFIAKHNGEKYIFFLGMGTSYDMESARTLALLKASSNLAMAIKNVITAQSTTIEDRLPNGTITRRIKRVLQKSVSARINVSLARQVAFAYKYIKIVSKNKLVYDFYMLLGMDYNIFKKRRAKALNELRKKRVATYRTIMRIKTALNRLDR